MVVTCFHLDAASYFGEVVTAIVFNNSSYLVRSPGRVALNFNRL